MSFNALVRHVGGAAVVDVSGRLTLSEGATPLRQTIQKLADDGHRMVLLNLNEVQYVDSSGLGALTVSLSLLKRSGGVLRLVNVPPRMRELIRLTRLDRVIPIFTDEESALAG